MRTLFGALALLSLLPLLARASAQPSAVALHSVNVSGPHQLAAVREVVEGGLAAVDRCFATREAAGATLASLRGALRLRIYIISDGRSVATAAEVDTLADALLVECAREVASGWRFGRARSPSDLRVTLSFGGGSVAALSGAMVAPRHDGMPPARRLPNDARPDPLPPPESIVRLGEARVSGHSSASDYRRALLRRVFTLRRCYDVERARSPDLAGLIALHYVVGPDGRVSAAYAEDDQFENEAVVDCVLRLVRRTEFPRPEGRPSAVVVQSISFQPPPEPAAR